MFRGSGAREGARVLTALVVGEFATIASARLFVVVPNEAEKPAASLDSEVAGHLEGAFIGEIDEINPAPEPIAISLTLEQATPVAGYLEETGLEAAEAKRWARIFQGSTAASEFERGHSLTLYKDPETED